MDTSSEEYSPSPASSTDDSAPTSTLKDAVNFLSEQPSTSASAGATQSPGGALNDPTACKEIFSAGKDEHFYRNFCGKSKKSEVKRLLKPDRRGCLAVHCPDMSWKDICYFHQAKASP